MAAAFSFEAEPAPTEWLQFEGVSDVWPLGGGWSAATAIDHLGRLSLRMVDAAELQRLRSGRPEMREYARVASIDDEGPLRYSVQRRVDRATAHR